MKISIIIPVYNVKPYLETCINSILKQSYTNLQIILVDDGSTDGCSEICDKFAKIDDRIIVIHQKNSGLSAARNSGIEIADGDFISFIDSDDFVHNQMFEYLMVAFEIDKDVGISCVNTMKFTLKSQINCESQKPVFKVADAETALKMYLDDISGYWIIACAKLYKRELFQEIRYPVGKIHEDEFTTYQLIYKAKKIAYAEQKYYYYLQRDDSIMSQRTFFSEINKIEAYLQRNQFLKKIKFDIETYMTDASRTLYSIRKLNGEIEKDNKEIFLKVLKLYRKWFWINWSALGKKEQISALCHILRRRIG